MYSWSHEFYQEHYKIVYKYVDSLGVEKWLKEDVNP